MKEYVYQLFRDPRGNPSKTAFYAFVSVFGGFGMQLLIVIGVLYGTKGAISLAQTPAFWMSCNTIILTGLGAYILHHRNPGNGEITSETAPPAVSGPAQQTAQVPGQAP